MLHATRPARAGYILILTCLALLVITGIAGLAIDLGRIYIARSELQAFADSAALSAALQLDGSSAGIVRAGYAAHSAALGPNALRWDMGTKTISEISISFAQGLAKEPNTPDDASWIEAPADPLPVRFVRVTAKVDAPVTFMSAFLVFRGGGEQRSMRVAATGTAGQMLTANLSGLLPLSVIAPAPDSAPDFGFKTAALYTIRYPVSGSLQACPGDREGSYWKGLAADRRGFWGGATIDIGKPLPIPDAVRDDPGHDALIERVGQDADAITSGYTEYLARGAGDGRRIVGAPIVSGPDFAVIGVGAFFLQPESVYKGANATDALCAEYIGPWTQGSFYNGAASNSARDRGGRVVRLAE